MPTEIIQYQPEPEDHLGMTDEQWARYQEYTHGYGDQDENGIDLSLLRENLKLTPSERLRRAQSAHDFFVGINGGGPKVRLS
jgi:hypothetical protein